MLSVLYNFHNSTCKLEGNLLENEDKSIQVVYQDGVYKRADQIIPLYEKYGNCCVEHLKDALSFCLYDKNKNQLLVVRDRIGEKQLYYAHLKNLI